MLTTKNYYTMESVIKKLQSTPIKFKSNFEIINIINNIKALQNTPLIIIVGEVHSDDLNNESYYLNDLKKLEEISNTLEIKTFFLEGLGFGQENNFENTILNAEVKVIKSLCKNKDYHIVGVEDLNIQIKVLEYGSLSLYSDYQIFIHEFFSTFLVNESFKKELNLLFEKIYSYVLNGRKDNFNVNLKVSMQLYIQMQIKANYIEIFEKIELFYTNLLLHLNPLKIFPKTLEELEFEITKIAKRTSLSPIYDKKKIEELHFRYISTIRDEIFTKNILESMKNQNISKLIFFCGINHMKPIAKLLQQNCEKILGNKVNIVLINIS